MSHSAFREAHARPIKATHSRTTMDMGDEGQFFRWLDPRRAVGDHSFPVYNEHVPGERSGRRTQINNWWFSFACVTSYAGLALGIAASELAFRSGVDPLQGGADAGGMVGLLCWCAVLLSLVTIGALAVHHDGAASLELQQGGRRPKVSDAGGGGAASMGADREFLRRLHLAGRHGTFLFDAGIQLLLPWPFLINNTIEVWDDVLGAPSRYSMLDLLVLTMLLRLLLLPRLAAVFHPLSSGNARIWARFTNQEIDTWFVVRLLLNDSVPFLLAFWAVSVLAFSYAMFVFERAYNIGVESNSALLHDSGLSTFMNCGWFIIITMSTIGYGDLSPVTRMGRIVAVVSCFAAVVLFALTVNLVLKLLTLSYSEENLLRVVDRFDARRSLHTAAARLIEAVYTRSPLYKRLRKHADQGMGPTRNYREVCMTDASTRTALPAWRAGRALAGLSGAELATLRATIRDPQVQRWLREVRRWRKVVRKIRGSDLANEQEQTSRLISSQARVEAKVRRLAGVLDQIASASEAGPSRTPELSS